MNARKKISKSHSKEPNTASKNSKMTTGGGKAGKTGKNHRPKKAGPKSNRGGGPYKFRGIRYQTKAALIVGYLDAHKVYTGKVRPPPVANFVRDTGVQAGHGMYGARLHKYCHTPRTDEEGTYAIDRRALRAGRDGRVFQEPSTPVLGQGHEAA